MTNTTSGLSDYSDEFIDSQVVYYRKHISSGNSYDRSLIHGQLMKYEAEQRRRASSAAEKA